MAHVIELETKSDLWKYRGSNLQVLFTWSITQCHWI